MAGNYDGSQELGAMPATTSGVDAGAAVGLGSLHEPTPDAASRPTDEDILAQENMIR